MYRFALLVLVIGACDDNGKPIVNHTLVSLSLSADTTAEVAGPAGMAIPVSVSATVDEDDAAIPVVGVQIAFAANATGVTFNPATATTDATGTASSLVVVPYGTTILATATSPGNGSDARQIAAPSVDLDVAEVGDPTPISGGQLVTLQAKATVAGSPVENVQLTFTSNTSGLVIAPSPALTDASGTVTARASVPYSASPITATVAGGNASKIVSLSSLMPSLSATVTTSAGIAIGSGAPAGSSNYQVTATFVDANNKPATGLPVAFNQYGVSPNNNPFTPSSATTDRNGQVTVFVTFAGTFDAVVTAAGVACAVALPAGGPCVVLPP